MHAEIADKHDQLKELCERYDVARLEVFGSAARGVDFDPAASDVDFLVVFKAGNRLKPLDQFFGLADALQDLLGRPVDYPCRHRSIPGGRLWSVMPGPGCGTCSSRRDRSVHRRPLDVKTGDGAALSRVSPTYRGPRGPRCGIRPNG